MKAAYDAVSFKRRQTNAAIVRIRRDAVMFSLPDCVGSNPFAYVHSLDPQEPATYKIAISDDVGFGYQCLGGMFAILVDTLCD